MTPHEFRKELTKTMPNYKWTVHKTSSSPNWLEATGTQSSGFNRLSTLRVTLRKKEESVSYEVKSSGFGLRAKWLETYKDDTLARALRGLQLKYEQLAQLYQSHAAALQNGRKQPA
jgi:hypothetical protein